MSRKYSMKEVKEIYRKNGYELISEYKDVNSKTIIKDDEGYVYVNMFCHFAEGKIPSKFHQNNPYTIQNIKLWIRNNVKGYKLLSTKYKRNNEKLLFECNSGHEFNMSWANFQRGHRCPYCCNRRVLQGYNDIYTTDPWMMNLGVSEEDAKTHTKWSRDKIVAICPNCKKEKIVMPNVIYKCKSIGCSCSDGVSYPEKFIVSLLDQINIKYIKEYSPTWCNNKRYDFYYELNDEKYIIEAHGTQHYERAFRKDSRTLKEEQENDRYKKELALNNGIDKYIVLDCRKSNIDWIKDSILKSELNNIFDLNEVDWKECDKFAIDSLIKEVCEYWNQKEEWETTKDLVNKFNLSKSTVHRYLKKGAEIGWCNYDAEEESRKRNSKGGKYKSKPIKMFKDGICVGVFKSIKDLDRRSEILFNTKLHNSNISAVCLNKRSSYKGFTFKYISKEEYYESNKKLLK